MYTLFRSNSDGRDRTNSCDSVMDEKFKVEIEEFLFRQKRDQVLVSAAVCYTCEVLNYVLLFGAF